MTQQAHTPTSADRVAIVTGASGGIGSAVAERLAADGLAVVAGYGSRKEAADQVVAAIEQAGGRAIAAQVDIADEASVGALFEAATEAFGGVDVVVHSAARMPLSPLADLDLDVLDGLYRDNIRSTFAIGKHAVRNLRPGGAIINLSSSVIALARPGYTAYAATKGAVEAVTLTLAHELRGRDITVNAVAPGPTATPMFLDGKPQELIDRIAGEPPLERLGEPDDTAALIAFLAGPGGRWVNGQVVRVNGGVI